MTNSTVSEYTLNSALGAEATSAPPQARHDTVAAVLPVASSRAKRVFDVAFSAVMLVLGAPILLLVAALIKLDSRGPILFAQQRIGLRGRRFTLYKFRTMFDRSPDQLHRTYVSHLIQQDAPYSNNGDGCVYKVVDDPRVTRLGHWLRRTGLDELPQFWNVLKGDMSVVGPRPPLPYEIEQYRHHHLRRLAGRPGITGLWQVSGRSRLGFEEMVRLDIEYLERWSLWADLRIMARTVPEILGFGHGY